MGETEPLRFAREFGVLILVGVVGVGVLIYGMWGQLVSEKATVEIIKSENSEDRIENSGTAQVVVDVAGAVEKPGVYKLPSGSRIGDVLVLAGGLSSNADREWVAKTVNLAKEIKDEEKIYIPSVLYKDDPSQMQSKGSSLGNKTNINTASVGELDKLAGIGEVRAQAIIAGRPYGSTEELVSRAGIPQSVYEKIKDQISVY